jgi:hypothetical protein
MPEPIDQTTLDLIAAIKELKFATAETHRYVQGGGAEHQAAREREARAIERARDLSRALIAEWHRVDPELKRLAESSPEWSALSEEVDQLLDEYRRLIEETRGGSSPES